MNDLKKVMESVSKSKANMLKSSVKKDTDYKRVKDKLVLLSDLVDQLYVSVDSYDKYKHDVNMSMIMIDSALFRFTSISNIILDILEIYAISNGVKTKDITNRVILDKFFDTYAVRMSDKEYDLLNDIILRNIVAHSYGSSESDLSIITYCNDHKDVMYTLKDLLESYMKDAGCYLYDKESAVAGRKK